MKNVKEVLNSGYLEAFVLGALNDDDTKMVSYWLQFSEVQDYLNELQNLLEQYTSQSELAPSEQIREIILNDNEFSSHSSSSVR